METTVEREDCGGGKGHVFDSIGLFCLLSHAAQNKLFERLTGENFGPRITQNLADGHVSRQLFCVPFYTCNMEGKIHKLP